MARRLPRLSPAQRWALRFLAAFVAAQLGFWALARRSGETHASSAGADAAGEVAGAAAGDIEPLRWRSGRCPAAPEAHVFLGGRLAKRAADGLPPCAADEAVSLVLPMALKDAARFAILDKSLKKFFDMAGVCEALVVAVDGEADEVARAVAGSWLAPHARVVRENVLVPELAQWEVPNWIRQQIIKLSMAAHVRTKFYVALDADVIAVKRCGLAELFVDGKAKTNMFPKEALSETVHAWYNGSGKVLGMEVPASQALRFGVTPAVLSTSVARGVGRHIEERFGLCWRQHLVDRVWDSFTEYGVYFTYAAATGLFHKYHVETQHGVYKEFALGVWWPSMIDTWDMKRVFDPKEPGCFTVAQSNTKIPPERFWEKVGPYIESPPIRGAAGVEASKLRTRNCAIASCELARSRARIRILNVIPHGHPIMASRSPRNAEKQTANF
eukprot:tig00000449_g961.t1